VVSIRPANTGYSTIPRNDIKKEILMVTYHKTTDTFTAGSMTLPQKYYTSDEVFEREKERIFNQYWTCAGHQSRIPTQEITSCSISLAKA
jgi:uncharacterized membrane protein